MKKDRRPRRESGRDRKAKQNPLKSRSRSSKHDARQGREGRDGQRPGGRTLVGRVQKNPRGFAFLVPVGGGEDAFVPPDEASQIMNDDIVEYRLVRQRGRFAARIVKIRERGQTEVLGQIKHSNRGSFVVTAEGESYAVDDLDWDLNQGLWVIARIKSFPSKERSGRVEVIDKLGEKLGPEHDLRIALSRFRIPSRFSDEAIEDARRGRERAIKVLKGGDRDQTRRRRDLRHLPFVTIDGEDAKDFDDAVLVEQPEGGPAFVLYVAIADVSFFVEEGTALDKEARERATSVYFPGVCIPMLPEELSNDLCSLRPREERFALVAEIHYDRDGKIQRSAFYEAIIKTARRLTYDEVHRFATGEREGWGELEKPLERMKQLHRKLTQDRSRRGVLDFDLPEAKVELDAKGYPVKLYRAPRYESHKFIEEMMIAANRVVAQALNEANEPALHRVHEAPDDQALDELNQLLKSFGVSETIREVSPKAFAKALEASANVPGVATLHQAILRKQKQARYSPEARGHFGLALADYAHFTSPIRRYPDLVVHRALKRLIYRRKDSEKNHEGLVTEMQGLGEHTSDKERRAMEAERFIVRRKQCWFFLDKLGKEYDGEVSGMNFRGLFITLPEFCTDGFLPAEQLEGDWVYDEARVTFRRRTGGDAIGVGHPMKVQLVRVSVEDGQIEFGSAEREEKEDIPPKTPARQKKRR